MSDEARGPRASPFLLQESIMSRTPSIAVIIEGGLVQYTIAQDWPEGVPLPRVAIVDYDTEYADEEDLIHFPVGGIPRIAVCRDEIPEVYEELAAAPSPKAILQALDERAGTSRPEEGSF
jgi:hypothetical protein